MVSTKYSEAAVEVLDILKPSISILIAFYELDQL